MIYSRKTNQGVVPNMIFCWSVLGKICGGLLAVSAMIFVVYGQNPVFEADRWERSKDAIIISDMSRVMPKTALSNIRKKRHWKTIEYETSQGLKGKSIAALVDTNAPKVTLPLNVKGWYAVYVGLGGMGRFVRNQESQVRVKLTNDVAYQHRIYGGATDDIEEVFFKTADLTGQNLHIAEMRMEALMDLRPTHNARHTVVMYVKLVPLTEKEIAWIKEDRAQKQTKNLTATLDGFSWIGRNYPTTKEEFFEDFEHYRDSDFGTISWQIIGGDLVNYKSKLGTVPGSLVDDYPRTGDGYVTDSIKRFNAKGTDLTKLAVEAVRSMDKKIMIGFRTQAWQAPPGFEDYFTSRFYRKHPEWRTYDKDGTPVMRMSYAVPQVRAHILGIFREILAYQPDGIEIIYFRGLPLMLYEDAFSKQFKAKYGQDAKEVSEDDPRFIELRGEIMTGFMRDIRKMMDEVQKAQGRKKRYELSATVLHTEADNRRQGLDVERWVKEGLIDTIGIFPGAYHTSAYNKYIGVSSGRRMELEWFSKITKGTKIEFYPMMISSTLRSHKTTLAQAQAYYKAGAGGLIFWDPSPSKLYSPSSNEPEKSYTNPVTSYWSVISRLGHREVLKELETANRPQTKYIPLKRYGDYWFGRFIPDVGF